MHWKKPLVDQFQDLFERVRDIYRDRYMKGGDRVRGQGKEASLLGYISDLLYIGLP